MFVPKAMSIRVRIYFSSSFASVNFLALFLCWHHKHMIFAFAVVVSARLREAELNDFGMCV